MRGALGTHDKRAADFSFQLLLLASPPHHTVCNAVTAVWRVYGASAIAGRPDLGLSAVGDDCPLDASIWPGRRARLTAYITCLHHLSFAGAPAIWSRGRPGWRGRTWMKSTASLGFGVYWGRGPCSCDSHRAGLFF